MVDTARVSNATPLLASGPESDITALLLKQSVEKARERIAIHYDGKEYLYSYDDHLFVEIQKTPNGMADKRRRLEERDLPSAVRTAFADFALPIAVAALASSADGLALINAARTRLPKEAWTAPGDFFSAFGKRHRELTADGLIIHDEQGGVSRVIAGVRGFSNESQAGMVSLLGDHFVPQNGALVRSADWEWVKEGLADLGMGFCHSENYMRAGIRDADGNLVGFRAWKWPDWNANPEARLFWEDLEGHRLPLQVERDENESGFDYGIFATGSAATGLVAGFFESHEDGETLYDENGELLFDVALNGADRGNAANGDYVLLDGAYYYVGDRRSELEELQGQACQQYLDWFEIGDEDQ